MVGHAHPDFVQGVYDGQIGIGPARESVVCNAGVHGAGTRTYLSRARN